ncbi:YDG domain-containing protein [Sphaerochaeta sp. PS]|uniref:YDG domain-containing protein n=1 Tax=Sphaerochaeta sp. PS TaxID=3076336 RepID=UPI0028A50DE6|nr:YDG domain-containing protein [Sphaerochaeta sp. PS]MDT4762463.1 YDG domain-containing protein [Sphaerochaeta sp. PS]
MKNMNRHISALLVVLACMLLLFVGCSDMMEKMGEIVLQVEFENVGVDVATYAISGTLAGSRSTILLENLTETTIKISDLTPGTWVLTVTAFDGDKTQIGTGSKEVLLSVGKLVEQTILVVFGQSTPNTLSPVAPTRFDNKGSVTGTTTAMEYKPASEDTYTVCTEGEIALVPGNYDFRLAAGKGLEAGPALLVTVPPYSPIVLTITDPILTTTKQYDKSTTAVILSPGGLTNVSPSDSVTITAVASYESESSGTGKTITVVYSITGNGSENYTKPVDYHTTGVITKKELTVSGTAIATSKVYDGLKAVLVTHPGDLSTGLEGDAVTLSSVTALCANPNAGSDKAVTIQYFLDGDDAANYQVLDDTSKKTSISKATLIATLEDYSKTYGDANPLFDVAVTGFVNGETALTASGYGAPTASHSTTTSTGVGSYPITITGGSATNYSFVTSDTKTLTVAKRPLSVTPIFNGKTYDGTTAGSGSFMVSNKVGSDDVKVHGTFTFVDAKAGTIKDVSVTGMALSGAHAGNYSLGTTTVSGRVTIYKATLTATLGTYVKTYGDANPNFDVAVTGFVNGETALTASGYGAPTASHSITTSTEVGQYYINIAGGSADNYSFNTTDTGTLSIQKKILTVSCVANNKIYDGTTAGTGSIAANGVVSGDVISVTGTFTFEDANATYSDPIRVTGITLSGDRSANYMVQSLIQTYATISKATLIATLDDYSKTYGDANPNFDVAVTGFVNGETALTASGYGAPTVSHSITTSTGVGRYPITITGGSATNYSFVTSDTGTLTVAKRPLSVTPIFNGKIYDGTTAGSGSFMVSNKVGSDDVDVHGTFTFADANAGISKAVSVTGMVLSGAKAGNYSLTTTTASSSVTIYKANMGGSISIIGNATVGNVLTSVPSLTNSGTPTYQWKRGGAAISGASSSTYTLVEADVGFAISITATAEGTNYTGSITSPATSTVMRSAPAAPSGSIVGYYPSSPSHSTIVNLTGFAVNTTGLEASVALTGSSYSAYAPITVDDRGRSRIYLAGNATSSSRVRIRVAAVSGTLAGADREIAVGSKALAVGDYYGGGVVGYLYKSGDPVAIGKGLIVAETHQGPIRWGIEGTYVGVDGYANDKLGAGATNTDTIITALSSEVSTSYAAGLARSYRGGGYSDWFLPSKGESTILYDNQTAIGGYLYALYWNSSECNQPGYSAVDNASGTEFSSSVGSSFVYGKNYQVLIRATRYFFD